MYSNIQHLTHSTLHIQHYTLPMIYIFCAPSGSGKSTMVQHLLHTYPNQFELSISCTTRPPRGQEVHGKEYYFISVDEFQERIKNNEFIEYEQVYEGLYYGTLK